ncbi:MAG: tRNA (adenosine(37)-N6)-threonylcarbamoyltransferase complex dimerization subunit type 1 TsaB [Clostridia bacterium]|nr:tRNA (adenosine(37)-N6)-threonylcarbamoyltransferase complex dimerization subunit type 1 TsaB [Clostridia bacterium]
MVILACDSSAKPCSVAILDGEKLVYQSFLNNKLTHSETLMPMIENALSLSGYDLSKIDAIAISKGPGSFTGVRIGVSAVKGIAMGRNIPCIGVSTLKSMAYNHKNCQKVICSVMDARRDQVYNGIFEFSHGILKVIEDDRAVSLDELKAELSKIEKDIILVGDGADLCYNYMKELSNLSIAEENVKYQNGYGVGLCAIEAYKNGEYDDFRTLVPGYLRKSQAQRELEEKEKRNV